MVAEQVEVLSKSMAPKPPAYGQAMVRAALPSPMPAVMKPEPALFFIFAKKPRNI
jgi:hypothetical protein